MKLIIEVTQDDFDANTTELELSNTELETEVWLDVLNRKVSVNIDEMIRALTAFKTK